MLIVEHMSTWGFEHAIRGMRNPMNSWDKSDSHFHYNDCLSCVHTNENCVKEHKICGDIVCFNIGEFDTYKVGTVANSCSTMHKIHTKKFKMEDFSHEHLNEACYLQLAHVIETLNVVRDVYVETNDKEYWWQMIQLLPSSYNQKRTITMNYENVMNIINHRNMNTITLKLISKTLASLISIILQNNLDLAQLKQNVYLDKLNLAAVLGVLLKRGLVSGSDVDEILVEIKRDSEVQEELQKWRDDLKKAQETTEKLLQYMKDLGN